MKSGYEVYVPELNGTSDAEVVSVCVRETATGTIVAKKEQTVIGNEEEKKRLRAPMLQQLIMDNPEYFEEEMPEGGMRMEVTE